jgi:hypothetical protein
VGDDVPDESFDGGDISSASLPSLDARRVPGDRVGLTKN